MKRIGVVLFTLLFVGILLIVPCFADSNYYYTVSIANTGVDVSLTYSTIDNVTGITNSGNQAPYSIVYNRSYIDPYTSVLSFYNNNDYAVQITFDTTSDAYHYPFTSFVVYSHSSVDVTIYFDLDGGLHSGIAKIASINPVNDSFSVFNVSGIIGSISNVFGMIFNSSTILLPLFLIGVTVSLGLVAIRYIRKVMWSR